MLINTLLLIYYFETGNLNFIIVLNITCVCVVLGVHVM